MKESIVIRFLYRTIPGRIILKVLVNPNISRASARFLSSSFSRWLVPAFVNIHKIDMSYYKVPEGGYRSFNDFFTRSMEERFMWYSDCDLVSPCNGLLTVSGINSDSVFHIKHTWYDLKELLQNEDLAKEYQGGTAFIFRLTPSHYHRYIWSSTGGLGERKGIRGFLHSVQPVCHEKVKVFIQNTREYAIIDNNKLGKVLQMEVGALLVGKISNHSCETGQTVYSGQEKGYFEYGGSSIVVLIKERVELSQDIQYRHVVGDEIPVIIGESLIKY